MLTYTRKTQSVGRWETLGVLFSVLFTENKTEFSNNINHLYKVFTFYEALNFLSSPMKWSSSISGLP